MHYGNCCRSLQPTCRSRSWSCNTCQLIIRRRWRSVSIRSAACQLPKPNDGDRPAPRTRADRTWRATLCAW